MRFDDRLQTTLRQPAQTVEHAAVQWRQLIDILAQHPREFAAEDVERGLGQAQILGEHVAERSKVGAIRSLYGRLRSPPLIALFANGSANICAASMASARLSDSDWAMLIPELPSRARGFLRNRRDLGPKALAMLDRWRSADFRLPGVVALVPETQIPSATETLQSPTVIQPQNPVHQAPALADAETVNTQVETEEIAQVPVSEVARAEGIGALVERIEQFRKHRSAINHEEPTLPLEGGADNYSDEEVNLFAFATDDSGVIVETDGVPPGSVVGIGISEPAFDDGPGPDGYASAAFHQRMPIESARMRLLGSPLITGDWRIEASPQFDDESGRFRGYSGFMRRPNSAEDASPEAADHRRADQLQQLLHELRTPLGAIIGFGEIIEQQLFGPVSGDYRDLAASILEDARRLLGGFDDLALAAQSEKGDVPAVIGLTQPDWLFNRIRDRLQTLTDTREVHLNLTKVEPMRAFALDQQGMERIAIRLLSSLVLASSKGEVLSGQLRTIIGSNPFNNFAIRLPVGIAEADETELLNAGHDNFDKDDGSAPLMGLGFSLRLVRSLAQNAGGNLRFLNGELLLQLPATREITP